MIKIILLGFFFALFCSACSQINMAKEYVNNEFEQLTTNKTDARLVSFFNKINTSAIQTLKKTNIKSTKQLSGDEIKQLIVGKTVFTNNGRGGNQSRIARFFRADQFFGIYGVDVGWRDHGRWLIKGDQFCSIWRVGERTCNTIHQSKDKKYYFIIKDHQIKNIIIAIAENDLAELSDFIDHMEFAYFSKATNADKPNILIPTAYSGGATTAIALSPDGHYLLTSGKDEPITLWEISSGEKLRMFRAGHGSKKLVFSPDGSKAVSLWNKHYVILWYIKTGKVLGRYSSNAVIKYIDFMSSGESVLVADNLSIGVLDLSSMQLTKKIEDNFTNNTIISSTDNRFLITGNVDNLYEKIDITLWDVVKGRKIRKFIPNPKTKKNPGQIPSSRYQDPIPLAISQDNKYLIAALSQDIPRTVQDKNVIHLWNLRSGKLIKTFSEKKSISPLISQLKFSADRRHFYSGHSGKNTPQTIKMWRVSTGKVIKTLKASAFDNLNEMKDIVLSPDKRTLITASNLSRGKDGDSLQLWDIKTGHVESLKQQTNFISHVTFSNDSKYALSTGWDKAIHLWDMGSGNLISRFYGHDSPITAAAFNPLTNVLITGGFDKKIRAFDIKTRRTLWKLEPPQWQTPVELLEMSPNGELLAISSGKKLILLNLNTRKQKIIGSFSSIRDLAFSPDSRYLLVGGYRILELWDVKLNRRVKKFLKSTSDRYKALQNEYSIGSLGKLFNSKSDSILRRLSKVSAVAFSPDGRYFAAGSIGGKLKMWSTATNREVKFFNERDPDRSGINDLIFSPDSRYLLTAREEGSLRLWNVSTGKTVMWFRSHSAEVKNIAFSQDGNRIISGGKDGSIRIWDSATGTQVVQMIPFNDGEWIVLTPDGYYHGSLEASSRIKWDFASGDLHELFSFQQFERIFNKPDLIKVRLAEQSKIRKQTLSVPRPPHIEMSDHLRSKQTTRSSYLLKLTASGQQTLENIRIFVNGKPRLTIPVKSRKKTISSRIPLFAGANRVTAVAYDKQGLSSNPKYVDVFSKQQNQAKPNLYVAAVGVSDYPKLSLDWQLDYAHSDASALINAFKKQEGRMFNKVYTHYLANEQATVPAINRMLDKLSYVNQNDIVVFFLAGHGVQDKQGEFYFLSSSGTFDTPQKGGMNWKLLQKKLAKISSRTLLFLDACHSGGIVTETIVPNNALAQQFFSGEIGGTIVFSASKGRQLSLESPDIGGGFGIFTYAITQALGKKSAIADKNDNGFIEFMELVKYVQNYVHKETEGQQTPWLSRKELFGDLPIAAK